MKLTPIREIVRKLLAERPDAPSSVIHAVILDYYELFYIGVRETDMRHMVKMIDDLVQEASGRNAGKVGA